jgi:glyoxylase-like metal-dependent hydrolase (beta-lactamase superfamily II)
LEVILTHGHWDHAGAGLQEFHEAETVIYMSEKDLCFFTDPQYSQTSHGLKASYFTPLSDGMIFDLGNIKLETVMLEGHTLGSCVFLEAEKQLLFTGDSTGAGVFWMQLPMCLPLREFRVKLMRLWDRVKDMNKLMIHPGHRNQSPIQLYLSFLADTILVTDKIIDGEWIGRDTEMTLSSGQHIRCKSVSYNLIRDYCYNPENI